MAETTFHTIQKHEQKRVRMFLGDSFCNKLITLNLFVVNLNFFYTKLKIAYFVTFVYVNYLFWFRFFGFFFIFNGVSTFMGYLIPKPSL